MCAIALEMGRKHESCELYPMEKEPENMKTMSYSPWK
jgi:hypothetical protein